MAFDVNLLSIISRDLPYPSREGGVSVNPRAHRYGEQLVIPYAKGFSVITDEGSYFVSDSQDNAVTYNLPTSFTDTTTTTCIIRNTAPIGGKRIYPDFIYFNPTLVSLGTSVQFAIKLDPAIRQTDGTIFPAQCVNPNLPSISIANVQLGQGTTSAPTGAARLVSRGVACGSPSAGSPLLFIFDTVNKSRSHLIDGVNPLLCIVLCPPIVLGSGINASMILHQWSPGDTPGVSAAITVGWWER